MVVCETLPLCPDTQIESFDQPVLTEPMEVGPYDQGIVFVKLMSINSSQTVTANVGISPYGYDDWEEHWDVLDSLSMDGEGMYSLPLSVFGNWVRLQLRIEEDSETTNGEATLQAWFVGKG